MKQASVASLSVPGGFHDGDWVESKDQDPDGEIRLLQLADVGDGSFRDRSDRRVNEETFERLNCSLVRPGDILIARMPDPLGRACLVPNDIGRAVTVVDVAVLRCDDTKAERRYVTYAINAAPTRSFMASLQDGATRQRIPRKRLGRVQVPLPELTEQCAIADYLDRETSRIDALIHEQEVLIEMLCERRDATWAVGLERAHEAGRVLDVRRVITSIADGPFGSSLTSAHYSDTGARVIRLGNIGINEFKDVDEAFIPVEYADELVAHSVEPGDVVVAGLGDDKMPLGRAAVVPDIGRAIVKADCYRLRPNELIGPEYFAWVLSAPQTRSQIMLLARGATRARLNTKVMQQVRIPVPDRNTQTALVEQAAVETAQIDALILEAKRFIELSRERRSALIAAAVTGQIHVDEAA